MPISSFFGPDDDDDGILGYARRILGKIQTGVSSLWSQAQTYQPASRAAPTPTPDQMAGLAQGGINTAGNLAAGTGNILAAGYDVVGLDPVAERLRSGGQAVQDFRLDEDLGWEVDPMSEMLGQVTTELGSMLAGGAGIGAAARHLAPRLPGVAGRFATAVGSRGGSMPTELAKDIGRFMPFDVTMAATPEGAGAGPLAGMLGLEGVQEWTEENWLQRMLAEAAMGAAPMAALTGLAGAGRAVKPAAKALGRQAKYALGSEFGGVPGAARPIDLVDEDAIDAAINLTRETGGATINVRTGENVAEGLTAPKYSVGTTRETEFVLEGMDDLHRPRVLEYLKDHERTLAENDFTLGIWRNPETNKVHLDLPKTTEDLSEASHLGRLGRQNDVFDLYTFSDFPIPELARGLDFSADHITPAAKRALEDVTAAKLIARGEELTRPRLVDELVKGFGEDIRPHLTDELFEVAAPRQVSRISRLTSDRILELPAISELLRVGVEQGGHRWYTGFIRFLTDAGMPDKDAHLLANLYAITSQQARADLDNVRFAFTAFEQYKMGDVILTGRFGQTPPPIKPASEFRTPQGLASAAAQPAKLELAARRGVTDLFRFNVGKRESLKVPTFAEVMRGRGTRPVIDMWLGIVFGLPRVPSARDFRLIQGLVEELALPLKGFEGQAAIWVSGKTIDEIFSGRGLESVAGAVTDPAHVRALYEGAVEAAPEQAARIRRPLTQVIKEDFSRELEHIVDLANRDAIPLSPRDKKIVDQIIGFAGLDELGAARARLLAYTASSMAGAIAGGSTGDTLEQRLQRAFVGALGAAGAAALTDAVIRSIRAAPDAAVELAKGPTLAEVWRSVDEPKVATEGVERGWRQLKEKGRRFWPAWRDPERSIPESEEIYLGGTWHNPEEALMEGPEAAPYGDLYRRVTEADWASGVKEGTSGFYDTRTNKFLTRAETEDVMGAGLGESNRLGLREEIQSRLAQRESDRLQEAAEAVPPERTKLPDFVQEMEDDLRFGLDQSGQKRLIAIRDELGEQLKQGVVTEKIVRARTREIINALGGDPSDLMRAKRRLSGEEALALREITTGNTEKLVKLENWLEDQAGALADATPEAIARAERLVETLENQTGEMLGKLVKETSQFGRNLQQAKLAAMMRINDPVYWVRRLQKLKGTTLDAAERAEVAKLALAGDGDGLVRMGDRVQRSPLAEKIGNLIKANFLNAGKTHFRNIVGTASHIALRGVADAPAYVFDRLIGAGLASRRGGFQVTKDPTALARSSMLGAKSAVEMVMRKTDRVPYQALVSKQKNIAKLDVGRRTSYLSEKFKAREADKGLWKSGEFSLPEKLRYPSFWLDKYVNGSFGILGAEDRFFRAVAMHASLFEQARTAAKNAGLKGDAFDDFVKDFLVKPSDDVTARAIQDAEVAVFTSDNRVAKAVLNLRRGIGKFEGGEVINALLFPFVTTPMNIVARTFEFTPMRLVSPKFWKSVKAVLKEADLGAQKELAEALGQMTVGTGLMTLGYALGLQEKATGLFPFNRDKRSQNIYSSSGKTPLSVKAGGRWHRIMEMAPAGPLIVYGAMLAEAALNPEAEGPPLKEEEWTSWKQAVETAYEGVKTTGRSSDRSAAFALGLLKSMSEMSPLTGSSTFLGALMEPEDKGPRLLRNVGRAFSPLGSAGAALAGAMDPKVRKQDVEGLPFGTGALAGGLMAATPGLSSMLPPKIDPTTGEEISRNADMSFAARLAQTYLNPLNSRLDRRDTDRVIAELDRLETGVPSLRPRAFDFAGMSAEDRVMVEQFYGQMTYAELDRLISSPGWDSLNDFEQANRIEKAISRLRSRITDIMKKRFQ